VDVRSGNQSLVNRVSGQRVHHEGTADETGGRARLRFSYQDADVRYPVLVTARSEPYGGAGYDLRDPTRQSLAWWIDHSASAAEWRRLANADAEHPPYGLWRRVDDALFDALACWPPTDRTGPEPSRGRSVRRNRTTPSRSPSVRLANPGMPAAGRPSRMSASSSRSVWAAARTAMAGPSSPPLPSLP